jgi:NTE family protein
MTDEAQFETRRRTRTKHHRPAVRPPLECIALLLQGGGALGSYQAGAYEVLPEDGLHPDWVAGISIGAINSALIVGNPSAERVGKLRAVLAGDHRQPAARLGGRVRAIRAARRLRPRPFQPGERGVGHGERRRQLLPAVPAARRAATDRRARGDQLLRDQRAQKHARGLVDFDRINEGTTRLSVGAVNVRSGTFVYFDTTTHSIRPGHVSSGKLAVDHAFQANRAISLKSSRGLRGNNLARSP